MEEYVYVRRWVEDCRVRLWTAQGNYEALLGWVQTSDLTLDDEPNFRRDIDHVILARALVALGRERPENSHLEDAIGLLDRLLEMSEKAGWRGKEIEILVLQSLALQAIGQNESALTSLEKALTIANPGGYVRTFLDEGEPMAKLLHKSDSPDIDNAYVDKLLANFEPGKDQAQSFANLSPVEPLTEREREVLHLLGTELSGPEISRELLVSLNTMRTHTKNIYSKLAVNNRRAAIHRAEELNLI
jgi:LuxR family maltose regulon positive regulatory protein